MKTYNVSIPDNKNAFFLEFLELIGAQYKKEEEIDFKLTEEQKQQLLKQNEVSLEQCMDANEVYHQLKKKYDL